MDRMGNVGAMMTMEQMWSGDWRARIRGRIHALGCETMGDFLNRHPAEPYHKMARGLGVDVAAAQLSRMQFEEATDAGALRLAALDGLARVIKNHLKRGWDVGRHVVFNTAGARADWLVLLEFRADAPHLLPRGEAVWDALKALDPPQGWLPDGPDDPMIQAAFDKAWPRETEA